MDEGEGGCSDTEVAGVMTLGNRIGSGHSGGGGGGGGGRSSASRGSGGERVLKFELQMYKMRDGEYCIDIQARPGRRLAACPQEEHGYAAPLRAYASPFQTKSAVFRKPCLMLTQDLFQKPSSCRQRPNAAQATSPRLCLVIKLSRCLQHALAFRPGQ